MSLLVVEFGHQSLRVSFVLPYKHVMNAKRISLYLYNSTNSNSSARHKKSVGLYRQQWVDLDIIYKRQRVYMGRAQTALLSGGWYKVRLPKKQL